MTQTDYSRRRVQAWGFTAGAPAAEEGRAALALARARFPTLRDEPRPALPLDAAVLPSPRIAPPAALAPLCATDLRARCLHALGRSYTDLVRARAGRFAPAPDVVAAPSTVAEVEAVLDWCADVGAACIPFGGGTSVVGGVNPPGDRPVVTLQLRRMDRVLEVDPVSQAAHIQAGASGPVLEDQLREHDLTLRFYPQSFELSTLGGWIATRAGGHFATGPTHIDDLVESVAAATPTGRWESRRLPASGAGPSPDRLLLGSEGILGVITDAWVRVQRRPAHRASASVGFADLPTAAEGVRALLQAGLTPAGCRILDPLEAALNGVGDGAAAVLVLGFESTDAPVDTTAARALELCADHGGHVVGDLRRRGPDDDDAGGDPSAAWRRAFLRAPYLRDALIGVGLLAETFETAVTWDRLTAAHAAITAATEAAMTEVCGDGMVTCRTTHAYPDGVALYYTVLAPAREGGEVEQWAQVKAAASEALLAAGGTITHHHAVGRDHLPWYTRQRPEPFAAALAAAKAAVDPAGVLNPGVLLG